MTEIVNLRLARKRAARKKRQYDAKQNRARASIGAQTKKLAARQSERDIKRHEGHRLEQLQPNPRKIAGSLKAQEPES